MGYESYRRLYNRYKIPSRQRAIGRLTHIMGPDFKSAPFEDAMTAWEDEISKYEKETGHSLPDDVKIAVMMKETKGHLQEHLRLHAGNLRTFQEVKQTVME